MWVGDLSAGDYVKFQGWSHAGGSATLVIEAIRLDAPPVYLSTGAPARVTPAEFAALTPVDGLEVYLRVDDAAGVLWHLRYNASSSSAYKWEFLGGPPLHAFTAAGAGVASGSYADVGGGVPALTLPLAGDYLVRHGLLGASASASVFDFKATVKFGAAAAADADAVSWASPVASTALEAANVMREFVKAGLAAGTVLKHQYKDSSAGQAVFYDRFISVTPVRAG